MAGMALKSEGKRLHASPWVVALNQYSRLDGPHCLVLTRQSASLIFARLVNIYEARMSFVLWGFLGCGRGGNRDFRVVFLKLKLDFIKLNLNL